MNDSLIDRFTPTERAGMIATRPPQSAIHNNELPHKHTRRLVEFFGLAVALMLYCIVVPLIPASLIVGAVAIGGYFAFNRYSQRRSEEEQAIEASWRRRVQEAAAILLDSPTDALAASFALPPVRDHAAGDGFAWRILDTRGAMTVVLVDFGGEVSVARTQPLPRHAPARIARPTFEPPATPVRALIADPPVLPPAMQAPRAAA